MKAVKKGTSLLQEFIEWLIYLAGYTLVFILVTITMPLIGVTFGLLYPFINVFLLKLVDWLLKSHFEIHNLFIFFFVAILL